MSPFHTTYELTYSNEKEKKPHRSGACEGINRVNNVTLGNLGQTKYKDDNKQVKTFVTRIREAYFYLSGRKQMFET